MISKMKLIIMILLILTVTHLFCNEKNNIFNKLNNYSNVNNEEVLERIKYGFYITGVIFPITNLLGFTYYGHDYVWYNFCMGVQSLFYYPPMIISGLLSALSLSLFSSSSVYYSFDFNTDFISFFIASIVCCSLSYIISLIAGICYTIGIYNERIKFYQTKKVGFDLNFNNRINLFCYLKI